MSYKNTRIKRLSNLPEDILKFLKENKKVQFNTYSIYLRFQDQVSYNTILNYLVNLEKERKIKKISFEEKITWQF